MADRLDDGNALRAWFRLLLIHKTLSKKISVRFRSQFGISTARFDTLAQLHAAGGQMTMGELSSHLMVTSGNVTGVVDGMVTDRLVQKHPHETDGRVTIIAMTPAGRNLFTKVQSALSKWMGDAMGEMTDAEVMQLTKLFGKLKHSADQWQWHLSFATVPVDILIERHGLWIRIRPSLHSVSANAERQSGRRGHTHSPTRPA